MKLKLLPLCAGLLSAPALFAQPFDMPPWDDNGFPPMGPGGPGQGGPGLMNEETKLVSQFDQDGDGRLNSEERKQARQSLSSQRGNRKFARPRGPGGPGGNESSSQPQPGIKLTPAEVAGVSNAPLYDEQVLRTLFLDFENADWEKELTDFHGTDVEVPARLTVDGGVYPEVGVHFRGASSYMMVGEGWKRSLNVSLDYANEDQRLDGYRTLNLLNSHEDPTFMRAVLYLHIAREYIPAPKANFVRVAINGENWGVYVSVEQFNKDFVKEWFGTTKGARWKVPGSPNGRGGLEYLGEDPQAYRRIYEIKSKDEPGSWAALIHLCKVLNQTPADQLEAALEPLLDVDGALKFLALENALINSDGYWIRASDYSLYLDVQGRFHVFPCDANETFSAAGGPGFGGGPGGRGGGMTGGGTSLDPLVGANDARKPLLAKLLAVPSLRARYLGYVHDIADKWLDWNRLGPLVAQYQSLIADDVKLDTRKLDSTEAFLNGMTNTASRVDGAFRGPRQPVSLAGFAAQRRAFLLSHPEELSKDR